MSTLKPGDRVRLIKPKHQQNSVPPVELGELGIVVGGLKELGVVWDCSQRGPLSLKPIDYFDGQSWVIDLCELAEPRPVQLSLFD